MTIQHDACDRFAESVAQARAHMVEVLKREGAITDPAVEAAFCAIPRHLFLESFHLREQTAPVRWKFMEPSAVSAQEWCQMVYNDDPRITRLDEIGNPTSSSSAPAIMAKMLEVAALSQGQRVLEIGTGTGYNAALLSFMVGNPALVTTIELENDLAELASDRLERVVGPGVHAIAGDGFLGYPPDAPYDRILATASTHRIPLAWLDQLREGGIIAMHLQGHLTGGCLLLFRKHGPGRSGSGQMITGTDFMEMRTSAAAPLAPRLLTQLLHEPITNMIRFSKDQFDPMLLWNHDFAFLLQALFPEMYLTSMSKQRGCPPQICLLDNQTHTLLTFQKNAEDQWNLEIRGETRVWEQVSTAYHQWLTAGCPAATAYQLCVDAHGEQELTLSTGASGKKISGWVIYEP